MRIDDVRAALEQKARDRRDDAGAIRTGDQQPCAETGRLGLGGYFLVLVVAAGAGVAFLTSVACSWPLAPSLPV